ncbi:MAG: glycosyltransferase family 4 protein [Bacteroidales bacterium]|nr:glycosyltransferase family 4 protein [Bacteroidales bacterium]
MNILLINHYAGSPEMGMEFRPYYMAREWISAGHNVLIIGASFSHLRQIQPQITESIIFEEIEGVNYCWLKTPEYLGNGFGRVKNILSFLRKFRKNRAQIIEKLRPDVVIASSTYPMDIYNSHKIAKKTGAKLVFEVHDLWPLSPMLLGGMKKYHPFILWVQKAENYAARNSNKIVSLLPCTKEHFVSKGANGNNWRYIPNGIIRGDWENPVPLNAEHSIFFEKTKSQGKTIIGYVGGHALSNALDIFLETAIDFGENKNFVFVLVGNGAEKERLKQKAGKADNIFFLNSVPKNQIPELLKSIDILYLGAAPSPLYKYGISMNKLYEYMMSGKPIIQAIEAGNNPVAECGCGISVKPDSKEEISVAIHKITGLTEEEKIMMGQKGKEYVLKNHDYSILAEKFLKIIQE